ncbi:MAG: DNA polymerase IV [Clostridiales bacterium]|nr:DNA polymerase IV [Clostridiales bacterium]
MTRQILHADMDCFFASVEELYHPEVGGRPMAVCGNPETRHGIVLAKNQAAKALGVKTAEPVWQAQRKCPGLILLPASKGLYSEYGRRANAIYERYTNMVQRVGVDESFLDVTGVLGLKDGAHAAREIRTAVRAELGLCVSVGVSFCKIFAKMGSDLAKPDGLFVITHENFKEKLYHLPVRSLISVGRSTEKSLKALGIHTVGQLAKLDEEAVAALLGSHGSTLYRYVHGLDNSKVRLAGDVDEPKSIGNSVTFYRDLSSREDIKEGLLSLADSVAYRLRRRGKKCRGVQITIKDPNLAVTLRQTQLERATNLTAEVFDAAFSLLLETWKPGRPIRLLGITGINLVPEDEGEQTSLFGDIESTQKRESLARAVDTVRDKYGKDAVGPATLLGSDLV